MQQLNVEHVARQHLSQHETPTERVPEARYAYYRRCQLFRKGSEQCKAPAEKGSPICHAHAAQTAMAVRRERERRAVLEEAVAQMRRRGNPRFEMRDLFMDFKGIQVTLAVMAQALIDGRIDCKTAGRLVVHLQTMSKLLRTYHRRHREAQRTRRTLTTKDARSAPLSRAQGRSGQASENEGLPQIFADDRKLDKPERQLERLPELPAVWSKAPEPNAEENWAARHRAKLKSSPLMNTDDADLRRAARAAGMNAETNPTANQREQARIGLTANVHAFADIRGRPLGPPGWARAA